MATPLPSDVTKLLQDWNGDNRAVLDRLLPWVYDELHRLAHRHLRSERPARRLADLYDAWGRPQQAAALRARNDREL